MMSFSTSLKMCFGTVTKITLFKKVSLEPLARGLKPGSLHHLSHSGMEFLPNIATWFWIKRLATPRDSAFWATHDSGYLATLPTLLEVRRHRDIQGQDLTSWLSHGHCSGIRQSHSQAWLFPWLTPSAKWGVQISQCIFWILISCQHILHICAYVLLWHILKFFLLRSKVLGQQPLCLPRPRPPSSRPCVEG